MHEAIIFDFDGVIADSEYLANQVLADCVAELGVPFTREDSYRQFMGKRFEEVIDTIKTLTGKQLPDNFPENFQQRTLDCFRDELHPVSGVGEFLDSVGEMPIAIASSSSLDRLLYCLEVLDLASVFAGNVFSASMVERGKPFPDVFLHTAKHLATAPDKCIVIEDSAGGVEAGVAAGMTVIGLTAASHIQPGHEEKLLQAGAHHVASDYLQVAQLTQKLAGNIPRA